MKLSLPEGVCDAHVHVGAFPRLQVTFTLDDLTKTLDKYKIRSALVFTGYIDAENGTKLIMKASEKDDRLYVLLRAQPTRYLDPGYIKQTERILRNNERVIGVKINPSTGKHKVTAHVYKELLRMLNDNRAVLLLHCGRWVEMSGWNYGIEIAKTYSHLTVVLAHMGGTHPDLAYPAIEAAKNLPNVYMDTSQTRQIQVIRKGIEELGASRILFGSDMPWGDYLQNLVGITQLDLDEETLRKVLRGNFNTLIKGD